jgi:hypothetical protein
MTLERLLKENGITIKEVKKEYEDLMENRGRYWLSDGYKLYKLMHENSKKRKEGFFLMYATILTGKFEEKEGIIHFKENLRLAKELFKRVTGRVFPDKPKYPDKDEFVRFLSRYTRVFQTALKEKVFLDVDRTFLGFRQYFLRKKKAEVKNIKLGLRIYDFIKDKRDVTEGQLLRRFSNLRSKELFPYLYFFSRGGAITWNLDSKRIFYIDDPAVYKHLRELKKRVRFIEPS